MEGLKTLICIILVSSYVIAKALNNENSNLDYRLPDALTPTYYDISYTMDPDKDGYSGYVFLHFDVAENVTIVDGIYLHADLDFLDITQIILNNLTTCNIGQMYEGDILQIDCSSTNITGQDNILGIEFTGKFSTEDGFGLVKTSYLDKGTDQILIESNFKPTYARRAFPCMDEPELRASFSLEISYPIQYKVISNTPVLVENIGNSIKTTQFEKTPRISTYLFSIFFSNLIEANSTTGDEFEVKIFTRPEVANLTVIADTYSTKVIEQLTEYTGVSYTNLNANESYLVALPNYYSEIMGDFGLFTYSERELLDDGDKTTARVKQDIITNIAYKVSHEWYGGDIATTWWSDIWANEAVATYFKYIIPDQIEEELELKNQFMVEVIQRALQHDALPLAKPLSSKESDVNLSRDIENKLDSFSYLKGASVLQMIEYVLRGDENLKSGLQYHFKQRQDLDTDGQDILSDLVMSQNKGEYYSSLEMWAFSPGFPLVTATIMESDNEKVGITHLAQKRFIYPIDDLPDYDDKWDIPLTSTTQGEKNFNKAMDVFFHTDDDMMYFGQSNVWLLFNLDGGSFYRVNYEEQLWMRLINYLKSDERTDIDVLSRARLVDDIFNIARIGDVSYALAFELVDYLEEETEYYPWYSALNAFSYLLGKLEDDAVEAKLKEYILQLMDNKIYIPSDTASSYTFSHIDQLKTVMILNWACDLGHSECISYATNKFKSFREDQTSLTDYNFRRLIFCNGIRNSENVLDDWSFLWNVYSNSPSIQEQIDILNGLGCTKDNSLLQTYLQRTIFTDSGINKENSLVVFQSVLSNFWGIDAAMEFLEDNIESIASFYNGVDVLSEMLYAVAEKLLTDEHIEWIKRIVNNTVLNDYEDVRSKAIVLVSVNNYWRNHYQSEVKSIFPVPETTTTIPTTTTTVATTTIGTTSTTQPSTTESSGERVFLSKFINAIVLLILLHTHV